MELHAGCLDELLLGGIEVALQIDDRLHAERREVGVVAAVRLGSAEVVRVDLAKVVDVDPCAGRAGASGCGFVGSGRADDWRQRERRG